MYLSVFIMDRQIVHVAYNTSYTYRKMQYYTIGWDMASDNAISILASLNGY